MLLLIVIIIFLLLYKENKTTVQPVVYVKPTFYENTRYVDDFKLMGFLSRINDEKKLKLYGRPTFKGSSQWEYVTYEKDPSGLSITNKLPYNKELYNEQTIKVPWLKSDFDVFLYDYSQPKYIPYI